MEQQPQLNDHNKQEYQDPVITTGYIQRIKEQKKKHRIDPILNWY